MIVRMAHWNCRQDCWGEDCELFDVGAVPIMQRHDGFIRAMLLGPPGETARIAFTVWSDPAAYRQFTESPDLAKITGMFAHMYVDGAPPRAQEFVVRAQGAAEQS